MSTLRERVKSQKTYYGHTWRPRIAEDFIGGKVSYAGLLKPWGDWQGCIEITDPEEIVSEGEIREKEGTWTVWLTRDLVDAAIQFELTEGDRIAFELETDTQQGVRSKFKVLIEKTGDSIDKVPDWKSLLRNGRE